MRERLHSKARDRQEVFAPVVRYDSIRMMLAIAAQKNMEIGQFDVKTIPQRTSNRGNLHRNSKRSNN